MATQQGAAAATASGAAAAVSSDSSEAAGMGQQPVSGDGERQGATAAELVSRLPLQLACVRDADAQGAEQRGQAASDLGQLVSHLPCPTPVKWCHGTLARHLELRTQPAPGVCKSMHTDMYHTLHGLSSAARATSL